MNFPFPSHRLLNLCVILAALGLISVSTENTSLNVGNSHLDEVSVEKLKNLVQRSKYTVVLLAQNDSVTSEAEILLSQLKSDLQKRLKSDVLKISDSRQLRNEYGIDSIPSILFFRQNNAVLYDGPFEVDFVMDWILENVKTSVRTLDDESFEHLTQAATGATTGDWFVLFCKANDELCRSLQPVWESVAIRLKSRLNVAFVDVEKSPDLVKRFKIEKSPQLIFFRLGKMYYYTYDKHDVSSLTGFASGWYKNVKAETIPQLPTPFDNIISNIVAKVQKELEDPYVVPAIVMLCLPFSIVLAAVYANRQNEKSKFE